MKNPKNTEFLTVPMKPELGRQIRLAAAEEGISRSEFMRRVAADYLKRKPKRVRYERRND